MILFPTHSQVRLLFISFSLLMMSCGEASDEKATDSQSQQNGWNAIFNGQNMDGWEVMGGEGNFYVENGAIVGETKMGIPNTFLATEKTYDNFVLELDFKVNPDLNSGVQLRSNTYEKDTTTAYISGSLEHSTRDWSAGRVYGYQIEIDPSDRSWTGGLYEEGGRGWLQPLENKEKAQNAFKQNEWNTMRVMAKNDSIIAHINGIETANYSDILHTSGFIGLQLHSIDDEEEAGKKLMFKNIRIREIE
ncbi:DUF1080 domain-containing protein [Aliifodinibius sp. S!AR15-10]|uniref:3-keto-disaccharide hydrolase n=1 Tax=Aliifodinibius sp. S!AR15-10 TaxID=2950437 RepID=UPI00285B492D|nr:DUF1080 domain-containing protein [Aliifodinibius sp. S!AR15-10]MDR8390062.1 DUF1080 domain-containing protein [Aliifodinibius sp. S!AR15-10]